MSFDPRPYRGRIAPTPTGYLHLGHARTFWTAWERAREVEGTVILRNDDLDLQRCKPEYVAAMIEDLHWIGLDWDEGPDIGGFAAPYNQSERRDFYVEAFNELLRRDRIYPCACSRKDVLSAAQAPHPEDDEPIYPGTCRPEPKGPTKFEIFESMLPQASASPAGLSAVDPEGGEPFKVNWRYRVTPGMKLRFDDENFGPQEFVAGKDFGDFVVWRHDDVPAYHLAVVVDDNAMGITEVVRGEDLLRSTARQLLVHDALQFLPPAYFHCPLVCDDQGNRLAKRNDALSLRKLRELGRSPEALRKTWDSE